MIIEYCRNDDLNFGDDLNKWLWPRLLSECLSPNDNIYLVGIGTLLTSKRFRLTLKNASKIVIFSSGSWGRDHPTLDSRCKIYGVRGPRTAQTLGISADSVVGDGAYLLRLLDFKPTSQKNETAFIPHHRSEQYVDWDSVCKKAGLKFISTRQPVESFLEEVRSCDKVIAEAMHGAIAADIFRIPWICTSFATNFNSDKWMDWSESMEVNLQIHQLPIVYARKLPLLKSLENWFKRSALSKLARSDKWRKLPVAFKTASSDDLDALSNALKSINTTATPSLSSDTRLAFITDRLTTQLEKLKSDYKTGRI